MHAARPIFALASALLSLGVPAYAQTGAPAADAITINSPVSVVQCQPLALTWNNAQANGLVYISAVPERNINSAPLIQFQPLSSGSGGSGSFTWPKVNLTAGTSFTLVVSDSRGTPNYSSMATVQAAPAGTTCDTVEGGGDGGDGDDSTASGATPTAVNSGTGGTSSSTPSTSSGTSTGANATSHSGTTSSPSANKTTAASANKSGAPSGPSNVLGQTITLATVAALIGAAVCFVA